MTHVTCRLAAKNRDQLRNRTLGNRVWATFSSDLRAIFFALSYFIDSSQNPLTLFILVCNQFTCAYVTNNFLMKNV